MTTQPHRPPLDGTILAMRQIAKHGRDRYPTAVAQAAKLVAEASELLLAVAEHFELHGDATHDIDECLHVRSELADTGLSLYSLAPKLGLDLLAAMDELVERDGRKF